MARTRIIVNPVAGNGRSAKKWERLEALLREEGLEFDAALTGGRGDATRLAAEAVEEGCNLVVAVGGDGTASEVANGLMAATSANPGDVRMGMVPTGRGVDFCRTVGIPVDCAEAARRLLSDRVVRLDVGEMHYISLGKPESRYFINFAGLGFDVEVTRRANSIAPRGGGTVPYLSAVFLSLFSYRNKRVEMVFDGKV
nr:diacylglycerol kinase family protein [Dehalococcoidales bacterium]